MQAEKIAAATASGDHGTTKGNQPLGRRGWCLMKMPEYTLSKLCTQYVQLAKNRRFRNTARIKVKP
jgi:hypothetical protein